jgi:O-glycosyl hydrolase
MKKLFLPVLLQAIFQIGYAQVDVSIDQTKEYQTIEGFGGFGPAKPWWESAPFYDEAYLDRTINDLGVTFFRTQIYWDGETSNDNDDPKVANASGFNFAPTVWTPPTWMKLFDDDDRRPTECYNCYQCTVGSPGTEMCGGRPNPEYYDEFAEYLVTYVKTLKEKTGVDLFGISIQNEPFFANPFESNVVLPEEYADILRVVGERFQEEGLTTKFFGPEHMAEWSWGWQTKYVNEILADPLVKPHLDIYAVHGYVDGVAADYGSAEGWTALYENISLAHDKPLWMTET